jgi:glucosylceramidase
MYQRVQTIYDDPEASKYVWGTAFHWYVGNHYDNVRLVHDAFPEKHLIYTEGGLGPGTLDDAVKSNQWDNAEHLATSIIEDLNNWTEGWVFWNLLLDDTGGPCHVGCHGLAPIMYDSRKNELVYLNTYYVFGHFSRFIKPGAKRIAATSNNDDLLTTAFLNPDGKVAVVVLNVGNKPAQFRVWAHEKAVKAILPTQSIATFVFKNN